MAANVFQFVGVHRDFVREDDFEQKHLPIVRNLRIMKNLGGCFTDLARTFLVLLPIDSNFCDTVDGRNPAPPGMYETL